MSRGPGRLQRRVLDVLAEPAWADDEFARREAKAEFNEWTTHNIARALSAEWLWNDTFNRQVRRCLDSLERQGRVTKRLAPNAPHYRKAPRSLWTLA